MPTIMTETVPSCFSHKSKPRRHGTNRDKRLFIDGAYYAVAAIGMLRFGALQVLLVWTLELAEEVIELLPVVLRNGEPAVFA
jgi:hypothetical protein